MYHQPSVTEVYVTFPTIFQHHWHFDYRNFHQMAELLGIVAGGAGLASLALQLVDGGQKLRQRYKNVKSLGVNISWLSEDIELIGKQLIQLETSADDIMQEQLGPIMMERCRDRSGQWKGELDELQALVTGLKQDISQYTIPPLIRRRYSLQPCLQIETVVDFNAPGFVIMEQLALEEIGWATAENMFKDLYKSCPGFVNQIDPLGRGYLEDGLPCPHKIDALLTRAIAFENIYRNEYGNTQPFDTTVNFLGQSALHMAVQQPSRVAQLLAAGHHVDQSDKYGGTPLLYAAAMDIPDKVMMLVENGANLLSSLSNCDPIICIVAGQQNWTLVWRIIDFAAASHPYLVPQLIKDLLVWTPEEVYHAAHHSKGQDGCVDFWSRVISKLGSPNFSFQDGKTLMHMARGVRSARALIKSGFNKFKQRKGDLLEHIASLHDPPLFRFAVANGGDAHLHSSWGWHILDMLLRDLARSDWDNLPKVLEILQGLLDNGVQVSSRDEWVCNCLTGGCVPGSKWFSIGPNLRLFAWLGILEKQRNMQEARNVSLALLRRMSFDQADLHHTYDTISHSDLVSDVDNNRFWDISEQISIDELKQKMEDLATKTYSELKIEVMVRLRVQKKMESNRWRLDYDLELAVVEFGVGLYRCGGDQFESWVPLLTQLTDVLLAEEESGALES
ncbi:hypothetical protein FOXYS1_2095 [Fusarium oxysporum]|uniref:Ankyrin n=1 Tax=Fusarium oxysporum TaxID=5507 RepID=A0A8H5ALU0_FUSOX|nr:hypothetical protein FOXYS1_2095 [Fusarium oxysporum]